VGKKEGGIKKGWDWRMKKGTLWPSTISSAIQWKTLSMENYRFMKKTGTSGPDSKAGFSNPGKDFSFRVGRRSCLLAKRAKKCSHNDKKKEKRGGRSKKKLSEADYRGCRAKDKKPTTKQQKVNPKQNEKKKKKKDQDGTKKRYKGGEKREKKRGI